MKNNFDYYKTWYNKWIRIFRWLCDKCEQTFRVKELIVKVKNHFWIIEWRMLCYKWYDSNVENQLLYPIKFK